LHSLYKWLRLFAEPSLKVVGIDHEAENRRLKRELSRVTEERDILKKSNGVLRAECKVKYAFMQAHRAEFSVRAMCRVLRIHVSGFYAWLKEPLSRRAQDDVRQTELIRQAWSDSGKVYGYRKLADDLRDQGERVS
jgi:putative transposase